MKTKLNDAEQLVADWIFDGNDASMFIEDDWGYDPAVALQGARSLEARGLVVIESSHVIATDAWLKAEGLA